MRATPELGQRQRQRAVGAVGGAAGGGRDGAADGARGRMAGGGWDGAAGSGRGGAVGGRARAALTAAAVLMAATVAVAAAVAATATGPATAKVRQAGGAAGEGWPQFRGPHRDGVAPAVALLSAWPASGPPQLWRVPIGEGYSHLTVVEGRVYTLFGTRDNEYLGAFDAASGRQLWVQRTDSELVNDQGNGPRSTPTYDAGTLYVQSAKGRLLAVAAATGKVVWSHDMAAEYGARMPTWGSASSPLVEGDLLLVAAGGSPRRSAMAFDKHTGKVVWSALDEKPGYASPIALTAAGERQAIFFTGSSVAALSPRDGRLLWQVPWQTDFDVNAATPLFIAPDKLFISSGYDTGAAVFQIRAAGGAGLSAEPVWKSRVLKNQFSSTVLGGDYLYGFDNGTFKCVNAATGEERWKQRGLGHGSVIRSGNLLLVLAESGKLLLVDAAPEAYRERASYQVFNGRSWTGPSLAGTTLFLRNGESMAAFDLAASHP
jgi:outer membrane protein assembly factor BamB